MTYSKLVLQSQLEHTCLVIAVKLPNVHHDFGIRAILVICS